MPRMTAESTRVIGGVHVELAVEPYTRAACATTIHSDVHKKRYKALLNLNKMQNYLRV